MPLPWEEWVPGLNNDHLTLREVFDTLPGAAPNEIAWHVRLLENPVSPIALPGAIELHPHDCVHILLGRGLLNQDEAFVLGYTMGTNKDIARWKIWLFKKLAQYFYPEPYKFSKGDALAFKLGIGHGIECNVEKIQDLSLFSDQYLDRKISDIRKELGISVPKLRAWYRKEKALIPDTKESMRLPVNRDITTTRLARPDGEEVDWYDKKNHIKKPISCGVIITDGEVILLGHSTGNRHWDIPKGSMDEGETYIDTALRELEEETSIVLTVDDLTDLGFQEYTPRKDLHLFLYRTDDLPPLQDIVCTSMCERGESMVPELDFFKYVPLEKIQGYTTANMNRTLERIKDEFK